MATDGSKPATVSTKPVVPAATPAIKAEAAKPEATAVAAGKAVAPQPVPVKPVAATPAITPAPAAPEPVHTKPAVKRVVKKAAPAKVAAPKAVAKRAVPAKAAKPVAAAVEAAAPIVEKAQAVITTAAQAVATTVQKEIPTMANVFETPKVEAPKVFAELNDKAKTAFEKGSKIFEEANEFTKGNVEALVESGKIAAKGLETLGQDTADYSRKSFEALTATLKSFASVKSPTEFFKLHSDYVRSSFDAAVAQGSKSTEAVIKLAGDAAQPLSNRFAVAAEKVKVVA